MFFNLAATRLQTALRRLLAIKSVWARRTARRQLAIDEVHPKRREAQALYCKLAHTAALSRVCRYEVVKHGYRGAR